MCHGRSRVHRRAPVPVSEDYVEPRYGDVECDACSWRCDLRHYEQALKAVGGVDWVFALAADMGGMGYIGKHHCEIIHNNAMINLNMAKVVRQGNSVTRLLYTSSACVYPEDMQMDDDAPLLAESMAWRGKPDTAYGIEKIFSEEVYRHLADETGIEIRLARFHNIFGPQGSWNDGREKAPAAMLRKAAMAKLCGSNRIEVWGDGLAVRSFCYIDDCLELLMRLMLSDYDEPLNIGTDQAVTINELALIAADCAGIEGAELVHIAGPMGVRARNADLSKMREVLDYEPQVSLRDGMQKTYEWIRQRVYETFS